MYIISFFFLVCLVQVLQFAFCLKIENSILSRIELIFCFDKFYLKLLFFLKNANYSINVFESYVLNTEGKNISTHTF